MSLTDLLFLFFFLPLSLAAYYAAPERIREYVLLALSLGFYALGSPRFFPLFLAAVAGTVLLGRLLRRAGSAGLRRALLLLGIAGNLGLLLYYKYTDFALATWSGVTGRPVALRGLALPLGVSFFTFKAVSYLVDVSRGTAVLDGPPVHDALYLSFFPQLQSGPLTRYAEMARPGAAERRELFTEGVRRFLCGFCKKVLLADVLAKIVNEAFALPAGELSCSLAWLGSVCFSLQLFFDFSGYSDMAIGLSGMFGYRCAENFRYPYATESVSRFWRRWHITLGAWFRDYVYIPLGGSRRKTGRVLFNLFVVWVLTGFWHGAAWNFVAWGLGYFVWIALERLTGLPGRLKTGWGRGLYRVLALLLINFQWVLFRAESLTAGLGFIGRMLTPGTAGLARVLFLLKDYGVFLLAALLFSTPVVPWLEQKLESRPRARKAFELAQAVCLLALFAWALSFVVAGQNNPFAYANF